jgi:hypothetical protein
MGSVKTDYNDIDDAIRDSIEDTQRGAETRAVREGEINTYTAEVAEGDIKMWQGEAREGYGKLERAIKDAIGGLPNWSGTDVTIEPNWDHKEGPIFWSYDSDPYIAVNAYVRLGQGSTAPGVTVFADHVTGLRASTTSSTPGTRTSSTTPPPSLTTSCWSRNFAIRAARGALATRSSRSTRLDLPRIEESTTMLARSRRTSS